MKSVSHHAMDDACSGGWRDANSLMNRIFSVVWNTSMCCWVVASELASKKTRSGPAVQRKRGFKTSRVAAIAVTLFSLGVMSPEVLAAGTTLGPLTSASDTSIAIGGGAGNTTASGISVAIGDGAVAAGANSVAIGRQITGTGTNAVGIGWTASAMASNSVAIGNAASVSNTAAAANSVALGSSSLATGAT